MGELIPLFPLATPLFPGIVLPLVVFEARYRRLVHDLLAVPEGSAQRSFGVVAIRQGWEVEQIAPAEALYDVGCSARVQDVRLEPDGRFSLVTVGARRFRLHELVVSDDPPYLRARVSWLPEQEAGADGEDDGVLPLLLRSVGELFTEYVGEVAARQGAAAAPAGAQTEQLLRAVGADPRALSYLVASAALLPTDDRQRLLEEGTVRARLSTESWLLRRELTLLRSLGAVPAPLQEFAVAMSAN